MSQPSSVPTPTIDKHYRAHLNHHRPIYIVRKHWFVVLRRTAAHLLILLPFVLLYLLWPSELITYPETLFLELILLGMALTIVVHNFVFWQTNVAHVYPRMLEIYYFQNLLNFQHESFEVDRLNTFDLTRTGLFSYFLDIADIHLSSIVRDMDAVDKLSFTNAAKPEEAIEYIKQQSLNQE